jgi:hypothetical protein
MRVRASSVVQNVNSDDILRYTGKCTHKVRESRHRRITLTTIDQEINVQGIPPFVTSYLQVLGQVGGTNLKRTDG